VYVGDRLAPVLPADVRSDHVRLHRSGTEERDVRDDLLELPGLCPPQQVSLSRALQLEQPDRLRGAQQFEGRLIIQRDGLEVDPLTGALLDEIETVGDGGVSAQAEDVHLHHPQILDVILVELGDDDALLGQCE